MTVDREALLSVVAGTLGRMYGARSDSEKQDRVIDTAVLMAEVWPFIERLEAENAMYRASSSRPTHERLHRENADLKRLVRWLHAYVARLGVVERNLPASLRPVLDAAHVQESTP